MARGIFFANITKGLVEGNPETLEAWHKVLCLPEDYKLIGAIRNDSFAPMGMHFLLESERIPASSLGLTRIDPVYRREFCEDGTSYAVLVRIDFVGA